MDNPVKITLVLLLNLIFITQGYSQQGGNLDSTFGINGKVTTAISHAYANSIALQSDGKIVLAGYSWEGWAVTRYNTDGSLDSTFGGNGIVTNVVPYAAYATSVAIQASGKILVLGGGEISAISRYNENGSIDSSFGTNGVRYVDHGSKLAVQADSRIIVAGTSWYGTGFPYYIYLTCIDSNGNGFSFVKYHLFGNYNAFAYDVALQADGKIITAGRTDSGSIFNGYFGIARFTQYGNFDNSFGINGHVTTSLNNASGASGVAIQPDGKIVAVGTPSFTVARYNSDGSLDNTFNGIGIVTTTIDMSYANDVLIQADGKIVVAGTSYGGVSKFIVARYNSDGTMDNSFGSGGITTTDFGTEAYGNSVAIQTDGKILVAGGYNEFCMARYLPGLEVGVLDFTTDNLPILIYPNPIQSEATVQYSLVDEETLSIYLYNTQGTLLQTFFHQRGKKHR